LDSKSKPDEKKSDEDTEEKINENTEKVESDQVSNNETEEKIEDSSESEDTKESEVEEHIEAEESEVIKEAEKDTKDEAPKDEVKTEEKSEAAVDDKKEEPVEDTKDEVPKEEVKTEDEPVKSEKEKKQPEEQKDDDFQYIVRIANTDIDGNKKVIHGLTSIKGVGVHVGSLVADKAGIDKKLKMGDLSEAQIDKIRKSLEEFTDTAPAWMLNHRKDYESGENIHLIGAEIDLRLRDEINIMKKIRSYRGIRHERGLTVRGQRTRANNRKGLALGVSKKREPSKK